MLGRTFYPYNAIQYLLVFLLGILNPLNFICCTFLMHIILKHEKEKKFYNFDIFFN